MQDIRNTNTFITTYLEDLLHACVIDLLLESDNEELKAETSKILAQIPTCAPISLRLKNEILEKTS